MNEVDYVHCPKCNAVVCCPQGSAATNCLFCGALEDTLNYFSIAPDAQMTKRASAQDRKNATSTPILVSECGLCGRQYTNDQLIGMAACACGHDVFHAEHPRKDPGPLPLWLDTQKAKASFPHRCPKCNSASYNGFSKVECSNKACSGGV